MTDDTQPAAAQAGQGAPRISDAEISRFVKAVECAWSEQCGPCLNVVHATALDVIGEMIRLRADLQQARAESERLVEGRDKMLWFIDHEIAMWSMAEVSPNLVPSMARFISELRQLHTMLSNALAATSEPAGAVPMQHQSTCPLGKYAYARCTCPAPPDRQADGSSQS